MELNIGVELAAGACSLNQQDKCGGTMYIRLLTAKDAKLYWQLRLKTLKQNPHAFLLTVAEEENKLQPVKKTAQQLKDPTRITLGAFDQKKLVGSITLQREVFEKIKHKGSVLSFFVENDYRGKGIGKILLKKVISIAKNCEIEQLILTVVAKNTDAIHLYEGMGFTVMGLEKKALKYENVYYDEKHMVLYL